MSDDEEEKAEEASEEGDGDGLSQEDVDAAMDGEGGAEEGGDALSEWDGEGDPPSAEKASLSELEDSANIPSEEDYPNIDRVLDLPVTLSVEIGTTEINIRNLLQLTQGSVIELDRLSGEPLDVKINGVLIAHGEVVVVNEKFGIRLTSVISTAERIEKLK